MKTLLSVGKLSDRDLYDFCKKFGTQAIIWRQKFAGLLPEVNRRGLYAKKGFCSIFEFAYKLAGMSEKQVRKALCLDKRFEEMPILREALEKGKVSINKLAVVAPIATIENQAKLFEQAKNLNCRELETLVRDIRSERKVATNIESQNGLFEAKEARGNTHVGIFDLGLSVEVVGKLAELKGRGVDLNTLILELLEKREQELALEKARIAEEMSGKPANRHIPAKVRKILRKEYGNKCAVEGCEKRANHIHHTARFGLVKYHNPYFMAPMCREHHAIAHSIDMKVVEKKRSI